MSLDTRNPRHRASARRTESTSVENHQQARRKKVKKDLIIVNTGQGKGKTTTGTYDRQESRNCQASRYVR